MSTSITVSGIVVTEPKYFTTSSGVAITSFRLASSERRFDRQASSWKYTPSSFYTVSTYRYLADNAKASLAKGDHVVVAGRIRVREWETGEKSGTDVEIEAESLGHDLNWGTSAYTRRAKAAPTVDSAGPDFLADPAAPQPDGDQAIVAHWPTVAVPSAQPELQETPF
ncbi:single-stranded DNA-binding protein [Gryllotalpicola sp.]|uniref:single-stranded DNA-binding protein n=1 Tax=Gryllotalpicola sp. TaxID=1932787 RepID=UPI002606FCF8|nr:single-stranded DNA-binding protein [Gryllotalpicola sp.]